MSQTKKKEILSFTFQTIDLSINKLNVAAKEWGQSDSLESLVSPPPPFFCTATHIIPMEHLLLQAIIPNGGGDRTDSLFCFLLSKCLLIN